MTEEFGILVSKDHKDTSSENPNDFIMNSSLGTIKFLKEGSASVVVPANSYANAEIEFTWVGGRPLVLLFVELTPGTGRWYIAPFSTAKIGSEDTYVSESIDDSFVTADSFIFKVVNTTGSEKTINYRYFVIGETGKEDE